MHQAPLARQRYRARVDYIAQRIVVVFGWAVLLTLALLIWHLASQALPLFQSPSIKQQSTIGLPEGEQVLYVGDIERGGLLITRSEDCAAHYYILSVQRSLQRIKRSPYACDSHVFVDSQHTQVYLIEYSSQNIVRVQQITSAGSILNLTPLVSRSLPSTPADPSQLRVSVQRNWAVFQYADAHQHQMLWVNTTNPTVTQLQTAPLGTQMLAMPAAKASVVVGPLGPSLWPIREELTARVQTTSDTPWVFTSQDPRAVYYSDNEGQISKWAVRNIEGLFTLEPIFTTFLNEQEIPVSVHADASVNLGLILTSQNRVVLFNRITGERLYHYALASAPKDVSWFGDYLYVRQAKSLGIWSVRDRDSTTTVSSLFQPQHYSGYEPGNYVWQTTNATDFQLAKYSVVPMVIGSLKASLAALLVAIPVALGAAIYSAYFAPARVRGVVKPVVEMLEAIPSVVIGFIAAVWLAPLADRFLVAVFLFFIITPLILFVSAFFQTRVTQRLPETLRHYWELPLVSLVLLIIGSVCLMYGLDAMIGLASNLGIPLVDWLTNTQISKTTLVVAVALGLAISPTIFSLADDAIESVPDHLKKASFALGATQLQTLRNVVLKVALPGIIAALMLGLGRAFGETMIVLMVTGNTPIADWDLFA